MQTNFAEFRDFRRNITKFRAKRNFGRNEISFEIRRIFETPIVSVKTKIRKAARIFERNIAETQRNFESAHRKFAAKIRTLTAFRLAGKTNGYQTGYKRVTKPFETGYTECSNG